MPVAQLKRSPELPTSWHQFAAGTFDFVALGYGPAVRIVATPAVADTRSAWSALHDCNDDNEPLTNLLDGYTHDSAGVTSITSDQAFVAYFCP